MIIVSTDFFFYLSLFIAAWISNFSSWSLIVLGFSFREISLRLVNSAFTLVLVSLNSSWQYSVHLFVISSDVCSVFPWLYLVSVSTFYLRLDQLVCLSRFLFLCARLKLLARKLQSLGLVVSCRSANTIVEIFVLSLLFSWLKSVLLHCSFRIWKLHSFLRDQYIAWFYVT